MNQNGTCAAHEILYDTVLHLRENQSQTYELIRDVSEKQAKQDTAISLINAGLTDIQSTQKQIIAMISKRKWTPGKIIALASALFGSGSAGYAIIAAVMK